MEESQANNSPTTQPVLSVVMPVFREAAHLPVILTEVRSFLAHCGLPYFASGLLQAALEHSDFSVVRELLEKNPAKPPEAGHKRRVPVEAHPGSDPRRSSR